MPRSRTLDPTQLDPIDTRILKILQRDASVSVAEVADEVGLSSSPCWRRIKRMEEAGLIERRVTLLSRDLLGLDFGAFVSVKLQKPNRENMRAFEDRVERMPEVVGCFVTTGAVDYVLRVVTKDMHAYEDWLREVLLGIDLVADVQSRIVLREAKATTELPLGLL